MITFPRAYHGIGSDCHDYGSVVQVVPVFREAFI
jgi:hypothetical protein